MTSKTLPPHGSLSRYRFHECRCEACVDRDRSYKRDRRRMKKEGTWAPFVDATPVRLHIRKLIAEGLTPNRIALRAGVSSSTVAGFLQHHGRIARRRQTTPDIAAKILAVTRSDTVPGLVDATGTQRRLQALSAAGWPITPLGPRCGVKPDHLRRVLLQRQVRGNTAAAVEALYSELSNKRPERAGISKEWANRMRRTAAQKGWAPPKYWDRFPGAIDDPHFIPEYGMTKPQRLAEEAVWLVTIAGVPRTEAATRLGLTFGEVDEALAYAAAA
ncbi:hypothetical protein [Streptomyces goshikiensis]|uniref:hypothetical protein n=1 Tax=Streptomyces goshikiensis TaxID=1942 RepID=UPI002E15732A|nr:hypothetical protein OG224_06890 [Streptomyces goshikiensis]